MTTTATPPAAVQMPALFGYQDRFVKDKSRFKVGCWSRQTGKDFSTARDIAEDIVERAGTTWMIAAPSERQSVESLEKVKMWLLAWQVAYSDEIAELENIELKATTIRLANGSRVIAVPGKPETVRGLSCNVWLNEFAFFENPDETWKAILPSITNPLRGGEKRVIITSTPNGKTGKGARFWQIVSDAENGIGKWSLHKIPLKLAIADGLPVDYDALVEAMGDLNASAQELDCEFIDGSNVLLPYEIIALAESVDASTAADPEFFWPSARDIRCGIDFGRSNDPTVCWTLELVGGIEITREVLVLRDMPTPQQEEILRTRIAACNRCCLDYTGPGIGLGDYLAKEFGVYNPAGHEFGKIELCTFTAAFKRDIFPKLRRAFEAPVKIRIPIAPDVREDLHAMQQTFTGGAFSYTAPRTAEGHSDRCTALALAHRAAESARAYFDPIPCDLGGGGGYYHADADLFLPNNADIANRPF